MSVKRYELREYVNNGPEVVERPDGAFVLASDYDALKNENVRLRNALAFYANPETWSNDDWNIKAVNVAEYADAGKAARLALIGEKGV